MADTNIEKIVEDFKVRLGMVPDSMVNVMVNSMLPRIVNKPFCIDLGIVHSDSMNDDVKLVFMFGARDCVDIMELENNNLVIEIENRPIEKIIAAKVVATPTTENSKELHYDDYDGVWCGDGCENIEVVIKDTKDFKAAKDEIADNLEYLVERVINNMESF